MKTRKLICIIFMIVLMTGLLSACKSTSDLAGEWKFTKAERDYDLDYVLNPTSKEYTVWKFTETTFREKEFVVLHYDGNKEPEKIEEAQYTLIGDQKIRISHINRPVDSETNLPVLPESSYYVYRYEVHGDELVMELVDQDMKPDKEEKIVGYFQKISKYDND